MSQSQSSRLQRSHLLAPVAPIFHAVASRRLAKARTTPSCSSYSSPELSPAECRPHAYPSGDLAVIGDKFEVDFERVSRREGRLEPARLGFSVRHKSYLNGRRQLALIWRYGVELQYLESDMVKVQRIWLCRLCHLARKHGDAFNVCGTSHITDHMRNVHRIDPATGLMPETPSKPAFSSPFEAAATAGSNTVISHSPWQEDSLQSALIDWVIAKDVSFANATSAATRGLLTWNRSSLLHALPNSRSTMSEYVKTKLEERKVEVGELLRAASSKISISVDIWTSSNHLSFLGVVAHFVGKQSINSILSFIRQPASLLHRSYSS
jgi:hypothetical protein